MTINSLARYHYEQAEQAQELSADAWARHMAEYIAALREPATEPGHMNNPPVWPVSGVRHVAAATKTPA